uniref:HAT C-terminal dimerisation domain-containing protein n=1 Tax=Nelumbo nucifera TaxID=4432 RepID=A0A822YMG0_NELNU|nr:TPA_asm: hypothetical protein HUJ06_010937 [Nelumbo nucifera]
MRFGCHTPTLREVPMKVLSQTCSSSRCVRNWSVFEHVHTKRRNMLEHQRLNDLVYIHYNLRLKNRKKMKGYDPIKVEHVDITGELGSG